MLLMMGIKRAGAEIRHRMPMLWMENTELMQLAERSSSCRDLNPVRTGSSI